MGLAIYSLKRTRLSTGEELGNITIFFPQVDERLDIRFNLTTEYLLEIGFPIECTMFVASNDTYNSARSFGFAHAIDITAYMDEKWELDNGSRIELTLDKSGSNDRYNMRFYTNYDSNFLWGNWSATTNNLASGLPAPVMVGQNEKGGISNSIWFGGITPTYGKSGYGGLFPSTDDSRYPDFFNGATPIYISKDPYNPGGESSPGGGVGDFDNTSDDVSIPDLPTISATDAGFITLFNPSISELHNLASYMWSDLFDINGWKKVFADPMQAILGLSIVPVNVPAASSKPVKVGNISTDVTMTVAASQYVVVDCGTLNVNEFWGAYLDYDPYTKAEIYLPYIGIHALSTDDIMGKSVHVVYHVDILSGSCCAYIKCGESVLYSFVGQCSSSVPITGDNWTNVINGALSIAGSIGSMVATGGASAPMAVGQIASAAVNQMKPSVEKSGSMGGTGGMLGIQTPYLILTRPRQAVPRDQNVFVGYPAYITSKLSELSGYTEIDSIHLVNIPATENEMSEIESLLKAGVIF